jgi:GrpB-like predicted nucleotidyltransferase (UPF0157 family)
MSEQNQVRIMEVVPYNPDWEKEYLKESKIIQNILGDEMIKIHHIGSTAIQSIYAKPVIDILIEVNDIKNIDNYNDEMNKIGYIPKGEFGIKGRRFFLKGLYNRTHHVHIFETKNQEIRKHLNFRDYMIAHPKVAKQYEKLKKELSTNFRYDNEGYCNGKDEFIKDIDRKAEEWFKTKNQYV